MRMLQAVGKRPNRIGAQGFSPGPCRGAIAGSAPASERGAAALGWRFARLRDSDGFVTCPGNRGQGEGGLGRRLAEIRGGSSMVTATEALGGRNGKRIVSRAEERWVIFAS